MTDPIDIKTKFKAVKASEVLFSKSSVNEVLSKSLSFSWHLWGQFQQVWIGNAYNTFKDHDKYLVLIYLVQDIWQSLSDKFTYNTLEEFYSKNEFIIEKINLIKISNDLHIPKETVRRKINEFQKAGILRREGKSIILKISLINFQRPMKSLEIIVNYIYKNSLFLQTEQWFGDPLTREEINFFIEKYFTICWLRFFKLQIPFLVRQRDVFGDLETFHIWGSIAVNHQSKVTREVMQNVIDQPVDTQYTEVVSKAKVQYGLNASSVSDITKIPRATVIRKLKWLVNKNLLKKNNKLQYFMDNSGNLNKKISLNFLKNREAANSFLTDIFDLIKNSNFKI
jgi:predicted transcriptional regulator